MQLDQLIAFNDEVSALSRAGIPLGYGLTQMGADLPNQLGNLTTNVGERIEQGESLADILAQQNGDFPKVYAAVIAAGVESGDLTSATNGLAQTLRRIANVRRNVGLAMIYPIMVLVVAVLLFAFCLRQVFPVLESAIHTFRIPEDRIIDNGVALMARTHLLALIIPITVIAAALVWWRRTGNAYVFRESATGWMYSWLPGACQLMHYGQVATFADLMALMVAQKTPFRQAIQLSANATGSPAIILDAQHMAQRVESGDFTPGKRHTKNGIPPLLLWSLASRPTNANLSDQLSRIAASYHRRAEELALWLRTSFPAIATTVLAGTITILYCSTFLVPWISFMARLVENAGRL